MIIGINASAAFKSQRTGVEEYTYRLLKHLKKLDVNKHQVILYADSKLKPQTSNLKADFEIKTLTFPFMWTQLRLGLEIFMHNPDVLFIPVHVLPLVHSRKSVVTIHGLEYEYYPKMYPSLFLRYLRWSTKYALKHAYKIIAVSNNTKKDLVRLYGGDPKKIEVVYHGVNKNQKPKTKNQKYKSKIKNILYLGRLERKKNVDRLVKAFNVLKTKYEVPHKLVLAGPPGYGFKEIEKVIKDSKARDDIIQKGYITEEEKWQLLKGADVFSFPSLYEGFGMPVLEAQSVGLPVVTSNISSLPEVVGESALKVNPLNIEEIAESIYRVVSDDKLRQNLVNRGYENIKRFSWEKCARETLRVLTI